MKRLGAKYKKKAERRLIGHEMVKAGIITPLQLRIAIKKWRKLKGDKKEFFGELLLKNGIVDEKTLTGFLEKHLDIPYAPLGYAEEADPQAIKLIPERMARHLKVIATGFDKETNKLIVVMHNPFDIVALDTIKIKTGYDIERRFSLGKNIERALDRYYGESAIKKSVQDFIEKRSGEERRKSPAEIYQSSKSLEDKLGMEASKTPVIEYVDRLLRDAIQERASDIHIEPSEDELAIRYRIDGVLRRKVPPPKEMEGAIITRFKILADMNIAETRLPQDGRLQIRAKNKDIDIRVASSPTIHGEKLVLRLLDSSSLLIDMGNLGMNDKDVEQFKSILKQPYGMVLVTGPTGSGKTTTLYSALNYINTSDKNIFTIEDPVEYRLKGINQIQAKYSIGLTFAAGLRTILRQDPDIIMIGEVRDLETLENAVKASLTGHLVLSTIHTNDAPSVVLRLMHMGLEPYLISSCLTLVIAQRLVRAICKNCKEKISFSPSVLQGFEKRAGIDLSKISLYHGRGCEACDRTGYMGRTALFEILPVSKKMRQMVLEGTSEVDLKKLAVEEGMVTIFQRGLEKVNEGITTIEEVLRVTVLEKGS